MGKWFPKVYDFLMAPLEKNKFKKVRKRFIAQAKGQVLEIGSGTGVNFPFYEKASHVTAIEPNPEMLKRALPKVTESPVTLETCLGKAERLSFPENTFDTVVGTLVFCTIADPEKALAEIRRVLKPDGKLLLFEHVRMNHRVLGKAQDVLTPVWKRFCDGCCLNRDTLQAAKDAGFHAEQVESFYNGLFVLAELSNQEE